MGFDHSDARNLLGEKLYLWRIAKRENNRLPSPINLNAKIHTLTSNVGFQAYVLDLRPTQVAAGLSNLSRLNAC